MSEDLRSRADQLAALMDEFRLSEAKLQGEGWKVAFRKHPRPNGSVVVAAPQADPAMADEAIEAPTPELAPVAKGSPVTSPMTGIYYGAPSPNAPPFVREGEVVSQGQVVGLIEAMKVFNEIVAPMSGTVLKIAAKNGDVVNPGEPLLFIG